MAEELNTINANMTQIPASILNIFNLPIPDSIPEPISEIPNTGIKRVVMVLLDNFGLFEIVAYKPEFIINTLESIVLLETADPYAIPVLHQIIHGDLKNENFNLLSFLNSQNKSSVIIGKGEDIKQFSGKSKLIESGGDMTTWIQGSKILNKEDLVWLNFQDFENLYKRSMMYKKAPPENLIKRLIHRTDKWLLGMYKRTRKDTLFIVLGNHGRTEIPMNLEGKYAEWRKASLPIAIISKK
ncbi:MAG: hypothetical protein GF329_12780 [Candidatus Lokiarchaeota archaeon]|nr:hypothetical protein [Candidatus Lokiarchaeota archaeon]